jgi:hypothetical protein
LREPAEEIEEFEVGGIEKRVRVESLLPSKIKESLVAFLRSNTNVFALCHEDMPEINPLVILYRLNVDQNHQPIKQKRRNFAPERNQAIHEEVEKLLQAGFIREVDYPEWLANIVLVKKSSGKWRMCVDFTDLNKACPNDSFPLPRMDILIDSTSRHELLSFMDAFSSYNQIHMHELNEEKTSFITDRGLHCYKMMSKRRCNLSKVSQQNVPRSNQEECGGIRG